MVNFLEDVMPYIMMVLVGLCILMFFFAISHQAYGYKKVVGDTYCLDKKGDKINEVTCEDIIICNDGFLKFMNSEDCKKDGRRLD